MLGTELGSSLSVQPRDQVFLCEPGAYDINKPDYLQTSAFESCTYRRVPPCPTLYLNFYFGLLGLASSMHFAAQTDLELPHFVSASQVSRPVRLGLTPLCFQKPGSHIPESPFYLLCTGPVRLLFNRHGSQVEKNNLKSRWYIVVNILYI